MPEYILEKGCQAIHIPSSYTRSLLMSSTPRPSRNIHLLIQDIISLQTGSTSISTHRTSLSIHASMIYHLLFTFLFASSSRRIDKPSPKKGGRFAGFRAACPAARVWSRHWLHHAACNGSRRDVNRSRDDCFHQLALGMPCV